MTNVSALLAGLTILFVWPLLNLALAGYATYLRTRDPHRPWPALVGRQGLTNGAGGAAGGGEVASYWLLIPCLNEERVIARTVRAALALPAGPGARVRVLVVDDGSDDTSPEVLAGIADPRLHVIRRDRPYARRGKGAALNAGYRLIRNWVAAAGEDPARVVVGVVDGDGRGTPNLLPEVGAAFRSRSVGAVQVRIRIRNRERLLGMAQDLEFGAVADASQLVRDRWDSVGLGGNGQFLRLSVLAALGRRPWSGCLVEDLELGLRLHLADVRVRYVSRAVMVQQGVVDVAQLVRQRTRWAQGNLQCVRYLGKLFLDRRIRNHTFLEMSYYLLAPWLNAVGAVVVAGFWAFATLRIATGAWPVPGSSMLGLAGAVLLAVLLPGLLWGLVHRWKLRDEALGRCLVGGLAYPVLLLLGLLATWRALGRQVAGRAGWAKTERLPELVMLP